jgi:MFS family permease
MRLPPDWRWAFLVVSICAVMSAIMRISIDSFAVFLLPLSHEFGWARSEAVSIYGLSMFSFGLGCLLAGRLIDRFGPRWTYSAGLAAIATVFLNVSNFQSLWQFVLSLGVVVGASAALIGMVSHAVLLSRWFRENLTFAISITFAASGLGMLAGAPLLQFLVNANGWRAAYTDLGFVIAGLAVFMPMLPWKRLQSRTGETPQRLRRQTGNSFWSNFRHVLADKGLVALFVIQFLTGISMFSLNPQIVAFFVEQGFDPVRSALAFGAAGIAGSIGVVGFGWLADQRGRQIAMTLSYMMTVGGFATLLAVLANPAWGLVILFVIVYGPTFGSRGPIINAMVPAMVGRGPGLGVKVGFVQLGMGLGAAVGSTTGGWLRDTSGYHGVIWLSMISGIAALILYWSMKSIRNL